MPRFESQTQPDVSYIFVTSVFFSFSYHKELPPHLHREAEDYERTPVGIKVSGPITEQGLEYTGGVLSGTP